MNVQKAAASSLVLIQEFWSIENRRTVPAPYFDRKENSLCHAEWMLKGIVEGYIQHEKAHRWLGWAQCLISVYGLASLDELKDINKLSNVSLVE